MTQPFELVRHTDVSGISGTGVVAWGVVFPDGRVVTRWNPRGKGPAQTCTWDRLADVLTVHGHAGATTVRWVNEPQASDRLARIAEAHRKDVGPHGLTSGGCTECGHSWPCPTSVWATTDRDLLAAWDPSDDEPPTDREGTA